MGRQQPNKLQHRTVEIRAEKDASGISGYASHFGSIDSYGTAMKRGAFAQTISQRGSRIPVLHNHWPDTVIGVPTELREDDKGLWFNADIVEETAAGAEVMALLRRGVPLGMSFGFETLKSRPVEEADSLDWSMAPDYFKTEEGRNEARVIEEVRLWEISVVTFPANEMATIDSVRQQEQADALHSLLEDLRAGRIGEDDTRWAQLREAAAFIETQPEPSDDTPLDITEALPVDLDRIAAYALAEARHMGLIEWSKQ